MARTIALAATRLPAFRLEALRTAIVCGCALALICARQPLPF